MSEQLIQLSENLKRSEKRGEDTDLHLFFDEGMARIWFELLTKAALYAGAIGLVAGIAAAVFFGG